MTLHIQAIMRWSWFTDQFFNNRKQREEKAFYENGSKLLEKLVASCNGKPIPIRTFSPHQLLLATNNYSSELLGNYCGYWYKGSLEGRIVLIKRFEYADLAINDLVISAQMSGHGNVLKPIGCCIHTPSPISVFEFAANGVLADRIFVSRVTERQHQPMVWKRRLKIARQIAHALSYLHTAFPRPVIHMYLQMGSILLDKHDVPKLSDFYFSVSIPEGEADVDTNLIPTFGAPEVRATSKTTEKADVYEFGRFLLELLTGEDSFLISRLTIDKDSTLVAYIRNRAQGSCINEIVDPAILAEDGEGGVSLPRQLQAVVDLALTCTEEDPQRRPTMVDVTKQLRRIERFTQEREALLGSLQNLKLHEEDPQRRPTMVDVTKQLRQIERFTQEREALLRSLQNLKLHERFEMLLWKIANDILLTGARMNQPCKMETTWCWCPLCETEEETCLHLFKNCSIAKAAWFSSSWWSFIESLNANNSFDLIKSIVSPPAHVLHEQVTKEQFVLIAAKIMDHIWRLRNQVMFGNKINKFPSSSFPKFVEI